jgi:hypothetical protein
MSNIDLNDLQVMVRDKLSFTTLEDYVNLCQVFLKLVKERSSFPLRLFY